MANPGLLNYESKRVIPHRVFEDLQLSRLLSEKAIRVLSRPCGKQNLAPRRELFSYLENPSLRQSFTALENEITEYERTLRQWDNAEDGLDKLHLQLQVFRGYLGIFDSVTGFPECGELMAGLSAGLSGGDATRLCGQLRTDCDEAEKLLVGMHRFSLSIANKSWVTDDIPPCAVLDEINAGARELGLNPAPEKEALSRPLPSMSRAVFRLFPDEYARVTALYARYSGIDLRAPAAYLPELSFFLEIAALSDRAFAAGMPVCLPETANSAEYTAESLCDVTLLIRGAGEVVPNAADFTAAEPFYFLTGANGGGKTTYLRSVGVNLIFAISGCPVYAKKARVFPFDTLLTHFPADERFDRSGRLDEETARAKEMLDPENGTAFLLFNETFSGTDEAQGYALLLDLAAGIRAGGLFGLFVTHFHDVSSAGFPMLCAEVDEQDGNRRTYHIVKKRGAAVSYAEDILRKYRIDKSSLDERRRKNGI